MPKQVDKLQLRELRKTWSDVNTSGMTEDEASTFNNHKMAVDLYIDDVSMKVITARTKLTNARICQLVRRCSTPVSNTGEIPGYAALIPNRFLSFKRTKIELLFDEYPKIGEKIRGTFYGDKAYTLEHRINLRALHGIFVKECKNAGIQDYEFPFTVKDHGYDALRVYINNLRNSEMDEAIKREGKDQAQQFLSTGYGQAYNINPKAPYDIVQIDGHIIDVLTVVTTTSVSGNEITDIATRIWVIAVIDVATRCIIGYSVSPHMNYNQFDVLEAIRNSIVPHEHSDFQLKTLFYPDGGGFPCEAIPETKWAGFNTIMLDNAKAHLAEHVVKKLTNELGCVMNFGSVATPETRGIVERFFGTLERSGFQRFPNTTGSNSQDPKRHNAEKNAADINLTFEDVCEILESLIAEYNTSAHSALDGYTPLQAMATKIRDAHMPIYTVPQVKREMVNKLTNITVERKLCGNYKTGKRPRINYEGATYHALDMQIPMSMVGEQVLIEADPSDLRIVKMYRKDGTFYCDMIAEGEYGRIPHSLKTRRMANHARNERMTPDSTFHPDIAHLTAELVDKGKKDRRSRTKAATIVREAKGTLDPKGPAEIVKFAPRPPRNLKKAAGKGELTPDEIMAIFDKHPNDQIAAINEINQKEKGM